MRFVRLALWGIVAFSLAGQTTQARADEWRIATLAPDGSAWMKVLRRGAKAMEDATARRVLFKFYAGGVQGDEKDAVRKMELGQLDGAALTSVGLSLIDESIRVLELPRMFNSEKELDYVREKMWPTFVERFAKKGYRLGGPGDVGFVYMYTNKPISSLEDLRSVKFWRWTEDKLGKALFGRLGLDGVPMGVPKVLSALQTGRINGCAASPLAMVALQWYTSVQFSSADPISYAIGASVVKAAKWDALSAEDKAAMRKIQSAQSTKLRKIVRKDNRKAKKTIGRSIQDNPLSAEAQKAVNDAAKWVWKNQSGKLYSPKDLKQVLKYRDEYRLANP